MCKAEYMSCRDPSVKYFWLWPHVENEEKTVHFLLAWYSTKSAFLKFHSAGTYVIKLHHSNVQVTII